MIFFLQTPTFPFMLYNYNRIRTKSKTYQKEFIKFRGFFFIMWEMDLFQSG